MLNLAGLVGDSIVDGPGIRMTVFCQGCPHHCKGCHNAETWSFEGGTPMEEEDILRIIQSNPLAKGVTFSGGEPFAQAEGFTKLAKLLKEQNYEVASYSGYTFEELYDGTVAQQKLLRNIDVLIDGRYVEAKRNLNLVYRGSSNQRIIDVKKSLEKGEAIEIKSGRWVGEY